MDFPGLEARKATLDDYEAINALSRKALSPSNYVTDYIAGSFHQYLDNERITPFVVSNGTDLLALDITFLVDGGRTLHMVGGRLAPESRKQGLLRFLMIGILNGIRGSCPHVERLRITSTLIKLYEDLREQGKFVFLDKRVILRCHLKVKKDSLFPLENKLEPVSEEQLSEAITNPVTCSRLFPKHTITNSNTIFDAMEDNVEDLCFFNDQRYRLVTDNGQATSMSLGGKMHCNDESSWRYNFNYYGDICREQLECHIRRHLDHFRSRDDNMDVFFIVMIPNSFADTLGEQKLTENVAAIFSEHLVDDNSVHLLYQVAAEFVSGDSKKLVKMLNANL